MKDVEIVKEFNIPKSTLQDWKHRDKSNWRRKVYNLLKIQTISKTKPAFDCYKCGFFNGVVCGMDFYAYPLAKNNDGLFPKDVVSCDAFYQRHFS